MSRPYFKDRRAAGRRLAQALPAYADRSDVLILALARGGVPVGAEVAKSLHVPLDVFIVRKLGMPGQEEYAIGAIASGGVRVLNQKAINLLGLTVNDLDAVTRMESNELLRREQLYRHDQALPELHERTVIVVDDGLATGSTMQVAVKALRALHARRVVVAVPLGSRDGCEALRREADEVICVHRPEPFESVGQWYEHFDPVLDDEVRELLQMSAR